MLKCKYSNIYDFVQRRMGKTIKKPQKNTLRLKFYSM